jgi:hypothetical protein
MVRPFAMRDIVSMDTRLTITTCIERRFAVPSSRLEILKLGDPACSILAERQQAGRRLGLFFRDDDDLDAPFRQIGEWFRKVNSALLVEAFDDGSHGFHLLAGLPSMGSPPRKRPWIYGHCTSRHAKQSIFLSPVRC